MSYNYTDTDCKIIAQRIKEHVFKPVNSFKATIFLCGADIKDEKTIRSNLARLLVENYYRYYYDIIYPEDIFDELLYNPKGKDLLSLENLLAESVDCIVIIPESPGSFAELGAFANDEKLRSKIICVVDQKYSKNKSFINKGPIKLVRETGKHKVVYVNPLNLSSQIDRLRSAITKTKKTSDKLSDRITLLQLENFLFPTIYLTEPINKQALVNIVRHATNDSSAVLTTEATLNILIKKRLIENVNDCYKLTSAGLKEFLQFKSLRNRKVSYEERMILDNLRLEILNLNYRKKRIREKIFSQVSA